MALQADIKLAGTITTKKPFRDISLSTPGSKDAHKSNNDNYPYYNEVLGVFNLLETPVVYYSESYDPVHIDGDGNRIYITKHYYNLGEIKYLINDAAFFDLSKSEMQVALEFEQSKTEYVPIRYAQSLIMVLESKEIDSKDGFSYGVWDGRQKLKGVSVLLNLRRKDADENTQNVLMTYRFPVKLDELSRRFKVPSKNLSFSNQTISGNHKALYHITVGSGTYLNSQTVLQAGNSITVKPGVTIKPNVTLKLNNKNSGKGLHPVSHTEVEQFCKSKIYNNNARKQYSNARTGTNNGSLENPINSKLNPVKKHGNHLVFSPNPAQDQVQIHYRFAKDNPYSAKITDRAGKVVHTQSINPQIPIVSVSHLANGLYIIVIQCDDKVIATEKLIINR